MFAQFGRQNDRGRGVVGFGHQVSRGRAGNFAHIKMLAKGADQGGRDGTLIFVDDGKEDAIAAIAGLSCGGDHHNYDNRNDQQGSHADAIAANEPEILKRHSKHLHEGAAPPALPYFRRIRLSRSSALIRERRSSSWLPRLAVRLTCSTVIAVASQASPAGLNR